VEAVLVFRSSVFTRILKLSILTEVRGVEQKKIKGIRGQFSNPIKYGHDQPDSAIDFAHVLLANHETSELTC
jgi:hypothetical protein